MLAGPIMATCPKCRMSFSYTEPHVCEGRDYTKLWSIVVAAGGALVGAPVGVLCGNSLIRAACAKPDAGNLCGLVPSFFVPGYAIVGASLGALAASALVIVIVHRRQ